MEARHLIREAVGRGHDSNGFKYYLAEHPDDLALFNRGKVDDAYRHFLQWQTGQVAQQVSVLFDPDDLPSRFFPRPVALHRILQLLNASELAPAWQAEETIGWVYQFFNEEEKIAVFDRLNRQKKRMRREDIPAATQLFTPRWIVRFIVENTLGRLWVQMHPHSRIGPALSYLVPLGNDIPAEPMRPVREITLLDPACGTMHFGLVAFDLFAEMYREELERAGEPGWPPQPSVPTASDIPAAILKHNLFAIDIDLRAVHLSALTLYLKAKSLDKHAQIVVSNLACADILPSSKQHLKRFLQEMQLESKALEQMLLDVWDRLVDINQAGSLLRLERAVMASVLKLGDLQLWGQRPRFGDRAAEGEYRAIVAEQVIHALDHFGKFLTRVGIGDRFFAGEAAKALRVFDLMLRRYDCVVTNPPYSGKKTMPEAVSHYLDLEYPYAKQDVFAAFIVRCAEFLSDNGRAGMITRHSFMFNTYFERLREKLTGEMVLETLVHLGPGAFDEISGEVVSTAMFCLRPGKPAEKRDQKRGIYFRLFEVPRGEKKAVLEEQLQKLRDKNDSAVGLVHSIPQGEFSQLPNKRWVYWLPQEVKNLIVTTKSRLSDVSKLSVGLQTGDNFRFMRRWWEIGNKSICFSASSCEETAQLDYKWYPYTKGGTVTRWVGNQTYVINWKDDGKEIRNHRSSAVRNSGTYFREALTFSSLGTTFGIRYLPPGFIYDQKSPSMHPPDSWQSIAATLNSKLFGLILRSLTPGGVLGDKDLDHVPFELPPHDWPGNKMAEVLVRLKMFATTGTEPALGFIFPLDSNDDRLVERELLLEESISDSVYGLYATEGERRTKIETMLNRLFTLPDEGGEEAEDKGIDEQDETELKGAPVQDSNASKISYAVGIVLGRFRLGVAGELGSAIYRREDFAIGSLPMPSDAEFDELVGTRDRFAYVDANGGRHIFSAEVEKSLQKLAVPDGITVLDENHERDLPARVSRALELMLGAEAAQEVINEGAGGDLRGFLGRGFFTRWHFKWYRKRPVYWPIQSANRSYGFVLFHEKINADTLYAVQREPYLDTKRNAVKLALSDFQASLKGAGSNRRQIERKMDDLRALQGELDEFAKALEAITQGGYRPEPNWIDDGVILRMAPLWTLIPIWKTEPKKYWERLQKGDFDWSHIAMRYWPARARDKCKRNKSFAIAHDLEHLYEGH